MENNFFRQSIEFIKGVGSKRSEQLKKELDINTVGEMLLYFPFRHIDRTKFHNIKDLHGNLPYIQVVAKLIQLQESGAGKSMRLVGYFSDGTGILEVLWFKGASWIKKKLNGSQTYILFGKPSVFNGKLNMIHPEIEPASTNSMNESNAIEPVYGVTENLKREFFTSKTLSKIIAQIILQAKGRISETLPQQITHSLGLLPFEEAITQIHFPDSFQKLELAQQRLKFEELFQIQLQLIYRMGSRKKNFNGFIFKNVGELFNNFYNHQLKFDLTNAQKRVIKEIRNDLKTGIQMNRLLQGDVGSGKTIVAVMSMLLAVDNGFQAAIMVPTEILATQHYKNISTLLAPLNISVELLTGSTKQSKRKELAKSLTNGTINILIGTHALIENNVQFHNLGLVIIDEQHRFGVAQRAKMWEKNSSPPHVLVMTATPIPRSLTMTLYGDMDYSVIDELPPGRKAIITKHMTDRDRLAIFGFIRKEIERGQQAYIVYPLIEESQKLDLKDLMDGYESISRAFPMPEYQISIVHGKMKADDKEFEMQRFVKGETQIMVSTTVIEVGVDVPKASVMIIENAERFGLSQLHQLRGRVGRGAQQSYCILVSNESLSADARTRIKTMVSTNDGFEVARVDLQLRGPGDMDGTQQSGIQHLKIADLMTDGKILRKARETAIAILSDDPNLAKEQNKMLLKLIHNKNNSSNNISWGDVL